ncbi:MAG: hypothetical protein ABFS30_07250, partial [Pseudomonadota bacterium]
PDYPRKSDYRVATFGNAIHPVKPSFHASGTLYFTVPGVCRTTNPANSPFPVRSCVAGTGLAWQSRSLKCHVNAKMVTKF